MAVQIPMVTNAKITMTMQPCVVAPLTNNGVLNLPLNFAGLTFNKNVYGAFTPENNYITAVQFSSQPTSLMVLVDGQANLILDTSNGSRILNSIPISRFFLWNGVVPTVAGGTYNILYLDGRTDSQTLATMAQGVPVNYSIYWWDGTVS